MPVIKLIAALRGIRLLVQTSIASTARRFDTRMLLLVGIFATGFAVFSFVIDNAVAQKGKSRSDSILKMRLSGPAPSPDIVIVDIDERSIAALSATRGNWPWPRDTLADALQKMADLGARAVLFNVLMSDPDKTHPDSDAAMDITASLVDRSAFPVIRLNPKNDGLSKLSVSTLAHAKLTTPGEPPTIAAVIPVFSAMRERGGIANQRPDGDGIVRRYPFEWTEHGYSLPSIVKMTMIAGGMEVTHLPDTLTLNWRNKKGRYQRISFVDAVAIVPNSTQARLFDNAIVVLGVSAPGIGQVKPTAVTAVEDDNEILATALDDAIHHSYFRTVPAWVSLLVSITAVWGLVWLAAARVGPEKINRSFVLLQLALGAVMLLLASYSYYLVDLSESMSFVLLVFAAVKLIRIMSDSSARARPGYRKTEIDPDARCLVLAGFRRKLVGRRTTLGWEYQVQQIAGLHHVIRIDDLFGGNSFVVADFADYEALIILCDEDRKSAVLAVFGDTQLSNAHVTSIALDENIDIGSDEFRHRVSSLLIRNAASLFSD